MRNVLVGKVFSPIQNGMYLIIRGDYNRPKENKKDLLDCLGISDVVQA